MGNRRPLQGAFSTLCGVLTRFVEFCYVPCMPKPAPNHELQRERFKQQVSRTALAQRSGLSKKALISIETRRSRPRLDTAARIARAFPQPVDIADLFHPEEVIG